MTDALAVARAAIEALNRGEWRTVAEATDREDVERWFGAFVGFEDRELPPVSAAEMQRYDPELPDAVAEYQAERLTRQRAEGLGKLPGLFAGIETRAELALLSPTDALARYLQARDPRWQLHEQLKTLDPRVLPLVRQNEPMKRREVVGAVAEGDDLAHVVYRTLYGVGAETEPGAAELHVLTVRRRPEGWRLRLHGELFEGGSAVLVLDAPEEPPGDVAGAEPGHRIRPAESGDVDAVRRFAEEWAASGGTLGYEAPSEALLRGVLGGCFFVAESGDGPIGYLYGQTRRDALHTAVVRAAADYLEIEDLYVAAEWRSRGLGREQGEAAQAWAAAQRIRYILVYSASRPVDPILGFYRRCGFESWAVQLYLDLDHPTDAT